MSYMDYTANGEYYVHNTSNILFYLTGLADVPGIATNTYLPGAVADHMTSYGGVLTGPSGQMSILRWLEAGATASYGTVVEPMANTSKFPQASRLVSAYFSGNTVLEAYTKSVVWPFEGAFVGEPLAKPYGTVAQISQPSGELQILTTLLMPGKIYALVGMQTVDGRGFQILEQNIKPAVQGFKTFTIANPVWPYYRLVETDMSPPEVTFITQDNLTIPNNAKITLLAQITDDSDVIESIEVRVDGQISSYRTGTPVKISPTQWSMVFNTDDSGTGHMWGLIPSASSQKTQPETRVKRFFCILLSLQIRRLR